MFLLSSGIFSRDTFNGDAKEKGYIPTWKYFDCMQYLAFYSIDLCIPLFTLSNSESLEIVKS